MKKLITLLFGCLFASFASASVIYSDYTDITETGQSYSQTISLTEEYENVSIEITAKGDYGYFSSEYIEFFLDDVLIATWSYNTSDITVTTNYVAWDYTLYSVISLSDEFWDLISGDGILTISWDNSSDVNPYSSEGGSDYVTYTLSGDIVDVSEPASLSILALSLIGIGLVRRKRSA